MANYQEWSGGLGEKEELELILSSIGDGVITINTKKQIIMMNKSAEKITGWSLGESLWRPLKEIFYIINKNTGESLDYLFDSSLINNRVLGLKKDSVLITKNGQKKYMSASIAPIESSGKPIGAVVVFRDITRIKLIEEKLIMEQDNISKLFEAAPIGLLLVDQDGIIRKANKALLKIIGKNKEEEIVNREIESSLACQDIFKPQTDCIIGSKCKRCGLTETLLKIVRAKDSSKKKETYDILSYDENGEDLWLKINSMTIVINSIKYKMITIDNITKLKIAEEGLKRYELLSKHANDIIIFADMDGRIIEINNAAQMAYGYPKEEMLGRSIFDLLTPNTRVPVRTQAHRKNGEGIFYESIARRKDNSVFYVETSLQSANFGGEKLFLSIQRDITERKKAEKELEKAREFAESANHAKSEFLANMSHEIRTPLNGILGMIDLTLLTNLTEDQKENLYVAKESASSLLKIIDDILDFSRIEARKLILENKNFDLINLVDQTVKPFMVKSIKKNIQFSHWISPDVPRYVKGDPNRLKQILNNLLVNAVKFTEEGSVKLYLNLKSKTREFFELEFQISDTGIGISPRDIDGIFSTFKQADSSMAKKYEGTGLGLAISKKLVEMMGGQIWVESQENNGSTFYFTIRLVMGDQVPLPVQEIGPIVNRKNSLKVLIVEDDRTNQIVIEGMLKKAGYSTLMANDGIEALEILGREEVDLILMDIQMPKLDGIETTKRIRKKERVSGGHIPIIALTAYALKGDREKFLAAGMDEYISKPVQIKVLIEKISQVLHRLGGQKNGLIFEAEKEIYNQYYQDYAGYGKEHIMDLNKVVDDISINKDFLKEALKAKDLFFIERYANEIKKLSNLASALDIKTAIFKVELAARRENIEEAIKYYKQFEDEFLSVKTKIKENWRDS